MTRVGPEVPQETSERALRDELERLQVELREAHAALARAPSPAVEADLAPVTSELSGLRDDVKLLSGELHQLHEARQRMDRERRQLERECEEEREQIRGLQRRFHTAVSTASSLSIPPLDPAPFNYRLVLVPLILFAIAMIATALVLSRSHG